MHTHTHTHNHTHRRAWITLWERSDGEVECVREVRGENGGNWKALAMLVNVLAVLELLVVPHHPAKNEQGENPPKAHTVIFIQWGLYFLLQYAQKVPGNQPLPKHDDWWERDMEARSSHVWILLTVAPRKPSGPLGPAEPGSPYEE